MKPRLLIVELHHMGDALLSVPFLRGAQDKYEVHVLCRPACAEVYRLAPEPPKIHAWDPPWADGAPCGPWAALAAAREAGRNLRSQNFAAAVCAWADARAQLVMAESGASRRIGFAMNARNYYAPSLPWRRARLAFGRAYGLFRALTVRPLLTDALHRESADQPHLACWEQIAGALGTRCDDSVPWVRAGKLPPDTDALFAETRAAGAKILAFHAEARLPSKQWSREKWREIIAAAPAGTAAVEIVGPLGEPVSGARVALTADLPSLAATLAAADAVVCHDSLPAHLAAALGKPVVAIFGSGEPDWFAPWNNRERVVQRRVCPLHPCIDRCGMDRPICLEQVEGADVLRKVSAIFSGA